MDNNFDVILKDVQELSDLFDQKLVFIGGVATYLYCLDNDLPEEVSHDADFTISDGDFLDFKKLYDSFEENKRLKKSQVIINSVEYDVYTGSNSSLLFSHDELVKNAVICNNVAVPALEHLLCLKMAAYENRRLSSKGDKDSRDVIKIISMINKKNDIDFELLSQLDEEFKINLLLNLEEIQKNKKAFLDIMNGNVKKASEIKKSFDAILQKFKSNINLNININKELSKRQKNREKHSKYEY